jgi:hypothetical protein
MTEEAEAQTEVSENEAAETGKEDTGDDEDDDHRGRGYWTSRAMMEGTSSFNLLDSNTLAASKLPKSAALLQTIAKIEIAVNYMMKNCASIMKPTTV